MKKDIKCSDFDDTVGQEAVLSSAKGLDVERLLESSSLYDAIPSGIIILGLNGKIKMVNLPGASMLGMESFLLTGLNFKQIIAKESVPTFTKFFQTVFSSKTRQNCRVKLAATAMKPSFIQFEGSVLDDGKSCVLSFIDVTDYEQRVEEQFALNEMLRLLNSSTSKEELIKSVTSFLRNFIGCDAIGVRLRDGEDYPYFETNGFPEKFVKAENFLCFRDIDGKVKMDSNGKPLLDCLCGRVIRGNIDFSKSYFTDSGSFWTNSISDLAETGLGTMEETLLRNRCGKEGYESVGLFPLRFKNESFGLLQINDERKGLFTSDNVFFLENCAHQLSISLQNLMHNEKLQFNYSLLSIAGETAKFGGWSVNAQDFSVNWSDEVAILHKRPAGYSPSLEEGIQHYAPEYQEKLRSCLAACVKRGIPFYEEMEIVDSQGDRIWVRVSGKAVRDNTNKICSVHGSFQDISEYKQVENSLKDTEATLREINATKDKFFSIIAHDLRNPFNSIIGFSNLLAGQIQEKNFDDMENYVTVIQQSSERAMDLLSNLLEWSRSQTGQLSIRPVHLDLASLVNDVVYSMNDIALQKSIAIDTELVDHVWVLVDRAMISTVLRNLISNAIKFSHPDTKIVVSSKRIGKESLVTVQDNGVGIRKIDLDKIFRIDKSFTKAGTANEKGTGLGLLLCKEFVAKHGGNIWVESEFSKGSTFSFTIPV